MEVQVNNFRKDIPIKYHTFFKQSISRIFANARENVASVYHLIGDRHNYKAGEETRFVIYLNATGLTEADPITFDTDVTLFGHKYNGTQLLPPVDGLINITSPEGHIVGQYNMQYNELNILADLCSEHHKSHEHILEEIFQHVNHIFLDRDSMSSWKRSKNKNETAKMLKEKLDATFHDQSRKTEQRLRDAEERVEELRRELGNQIRAVQNYMKQVEMYRSGEHNAFEKYIADFDLIIALDKVEDLTIEEGKIVILAYP